MFSANQTPAGVRKDTVRNVETTRKFCWNLATWELREYVNASAQWLDHGVDEFEKVGLDKEMSRVIEGVPMVKRSPVKFECEYYNTLRLPGNPPMGTADVIIGKVVGIHIAEWALTDGKLDPLKTAPIARCGYYQYTVIREVFDMIIPGEDDALRFGMEGNVRKHKAFMNGTNGNIDEQMKDGEQPKEDKAVEEKAMEHKAVEHKAMERKAMEHKWIRD